MKNLMEIKEKYIMDLVDYYGEKFCLSKKEIEDYFNKRAKYLKGLTIEMIIKEELFYIANPNANFSDFRLYLEKEGVD